MWKVSFQLRRHKDKINAVSMSHDEVYIATASSDAMVGIYNSVRQKQIFLGGQKAPITDVAFSPSDNILASSCFDGAISLWNVEAGERIRELKQHQKPARCVRWSPDGQYLISGSHDRTSVIWSAVDGTRVQILPPLGGWVKTIDWSEDLIAIAGASKTALLVDARLGKVVQTLDTESTSDINTVSFHRSGTTLAGAGFDRNIRIWDLRRSEISRVQEAHSDVITGIAFNRNSDDLLTVAADGIARIWNYRTFDILSAFRQHDGPVNACCWMPQTLGFITVGDDLKICGFEYEDEQTRDEDCDGGDLLNALNRIQETLENLTSTMKGLDNRLMAQEERVRWLKDNNDPILRAYKKTIESW